VVCLFFNPLRGLWKLFFWIDFRRPFSRAPVHLFAFGSPAEATRPPPFSFSRLEPAPPNSFFFSCVPSKISDSFIIYTPRPNLSTRGRCKSPFSSPPKPSPAFFSTPGSHLGLLFLPPPFLPAARLIHSPSSIGKD